MNSTSFETADPTLKKAVVNAATNAVRQYGEHGLSLDRAIDRGWTWVLDHGAWVQELMDDHPTGWSKIVARIVEAECRYYGDALRSARLGIRSYENFYYTTGAIEIAVRASFHPSGWMDAPVPEMPGMAFFRPTAPHSDWIVSMADVSRAMKRLAPDERRTLEALYRCDVPNRLLADAYGLSQSAMSDRKDAILRKLLRFLGGQRPERQCLDSCDHPERPVPVAA